ncbi:MAG TPA: hypothetical protein VMD08_03860 [Candidatus Baltobacteraceae bacterium]|nr:hypothetical protein [Candidatus Baltobacteraceae bacterium]
MDDSPRRRRDDREVPDWAIDLMKAVSDMRAETGSRLARLEAGVVVIAFVITTGIALAAVLHLGG